MKNSQDSIYGISSKTVMNNQQEEIFPQAFNSARTGAYGVEWVQPWTLQKGLNREGGILLFFWKI